MSLTSKKSNLDLNWSVGDSDKNVDVGQLNGDSQKSMSSSSTSSPQASPKVLHRTRGSKNNSSGNLSVNNAIAEESMHDKSVEQCDGSSLQDHDDAGSRSSESNKSCDVSFLRSPDSSSCRDLLKEKKSSDKKRKTSSWYNVLNPTYKSKTEDFKRLFKDLPDTERLIVDYSCALQKDILVQGRLYISQNFICFYANIFRWETYLTIRCKDITSMTKEKTALVIPNAIQICTVTEKHFFTSFGARDKAHLMLFRVWQNALLEQPMSPQELWAWIHYSYGDELGLTSDDDDYVAKPVADDESSKGSNSECMLTDGVRKSLASYELFSGSRMIDSPTDTFDSPTLLGVDQISSSPLPVPSTTHLLQHTFNGVHMMEDVDDDVDEDNSEDEFFENDEQEVKSPVNGLTPESDKMTVSTNLSEVSGTREDNEGPTPEDGSKLNICTKSEELPSKSISDFSESDIDVGEVQCLCERHEGRELINRVLPFSVEHLLELLFSDSKFYNDFQASRRTTELVHTPWSLQNGCKVRQVTYTLNLTLPMGIKFAHATETQTMEKNSQPERVYCIDVDALTTGIPYSDNFYTHHLYCITRLSAEESRLKVHSEIKYKKSVWGLVKSIIEKNTWNALDDHFKSLDAALEREGNAKLQTNASKSKKVKKTRRIASNAKLKTDKSDTPESPDENIQHLRKTGSSPSIHRDMPKPVTSDVLVPIVLVILILLLILNALLYYKLWAIEANNNRYVFPNYIMNPDLISSPKSNDDWVRLIQQQEALYQAEIIKWREVIDTVVSVLRETEDSLVSLRQSMLPVTFSGNSNRPEASGA